jgi:hypothetical protein
MAKIKELKDGQTYIGKGGRKVTVYESEGFYAVCTTEIPEGIYGEYMPYKQALSLVNRLAFGRYSKPKYWIPKASKPAIRVRFK